MHLVDTAQCTPAKELETPNPELEFQWRKHIERFLQVSALPGFSAEAAKASSATQAESCTALMSLEVEGTVIFHSSTQSVRCYTTNSTTKSFDYHCSFSECAYFSLMSSIIQHHTDLHLPKETTPHPSIQGPIPWKSVRPARPRPFRGCTCSAAFLLPWVNRLS